MRQRRRKPEQWVRWIFTTRTLRLVSLSRIVGYELAHDRVH
jgi:hypothetical protein